MYIFISNQASNHKGITYSVINKTIFLLMGKMDFEYDTDHIFDMTHKFSPEMTRVEILKRGTVVYQGD